MGNLVVVGASGDLLGKNFFGNETQQFIDHNKELNNLTQYLLGGNIRHAMYDYGTEGGETEYSIPNISWNKTCIFPSSSNANG